MYFSIGLLKHKVIKVGTHYGDALGGRDVSAPRVFVAGEWEASCVMKQGQNGLSFQCRIMCISLHKIVHQYTYYANTRGGFYPLHVP